jgi:hypothetical protein
MFMAVDLPQPDGPTTVMNSPSSMSRLRPWSALKDVCPAMMNVLVTFWNEILMLIAFPAMRSERHRMR